MNYFNRTFVTAQPKLTDSSINTVGLRSALPRSDEISQCSFQELLQIVEDFDRISQSAAPDVADQAHQREQQVLEEIQSRKIRFAELQLKLNISLQQLKSLNAQLYDRVLLRVDFDQAMEQVWDGNESLLDQELANCHQVIHEFYEELALRRLAPIACQKRKLIRKARRNELFYEYLPVLSLIGTTCLLHFWLTWTWSLIGAMFIVGPMLIWVAYPKRCEFRAWAAQTLRSQRTSIVQGQGDLNAQEVQALNLMLVIEEQPA